MLFYSTAFLLFSSIFSIFFRTFRSPSPAPPVYSHPMEQLFEELESNIHIFCQNLKKSAANLTEDDRRNCSERIAVSWKKLKKLIFFSKFLFSVYGENVSFGNEKIAEKQEIENRQRSHSRQSRATQKEQIIDFLEFFKSILKFLFHFYWFPMLSLLVSFFINNQ